MKRFLLVTLLLSVVWSLSAQDKALAIRNNLLQEGNNSVLVVSHRADWRNALLWWKLSRGHVSEENKRRAFDFDAR